jgi:hypothetical protein
MLRWNEIPQSAPPPPPPPKPVWYPPPAPKPKPKPASSACPYYANPWPAVPFVKPKPKPQPFIPYANPWPSIPFKPQPKYEAAPVKPYTSALNYTPASVLNYTPASGQATQKPTNPYNNPTYLPAASMALGLAEAGKAINASSQVTFSIEKPWTYIYGTRAAREAVGLNPYTNRIKTNHLPGEQLLEHPPTTSVIGQGATGALKAVDSWGTVGSIGYYVADDSITYATGGYNRPQYASALLMDTLAMVGVAAVAGATAGAVAGGIGGAIVLPVVGAVPGVVIGAVAGAIVGVAGCLLWDAARGPLIDNAAQHLENFNNKLKPEYRMNWDTP